jgi:Zn-dependent peptidase ImmA (M78 family)
VSDVAPLLDLKHGRLEEYARHDTEIELTDIKRIAKYFKKPWTYLLIEEEEVLINKNDNRTYGNKKAGLVNEMVNELENTNYILGMSSKLFPDTKAEIYNPGVYAHNLDKLASRVRDYLGVTLDKQFECKDDYEALRMWVEAVQAKGIYVAQRAIPQDDIRAYSLREGDKAILVLSTKDRASARIFSLFHEYGHLMFKNEGICDLNQLVATEKKCNQFSAALLIPSSYLSIHTAGHRFGQSIDEDEEYIHELSAKFRVSLASMLIKLQNLGLIDNQEYSKLETRRKKKLSKKRKPGFADPNLTALYSVGTRYSQEIFTALGEGSIDRGDASSLLGVGEHRIDGIREKLYARS